MYLTNVADYDNMTDDYNNSLSKNNNCTNNKKIIDKIIQKLLLTIPGGLSFLCSISLMLYTLFEPLFNNEGLWRSIYIQVILYVL